jgi:hypothetical protein
MQQICRLCSMCAFSPATCRLYRSSRESEPSTDESVQCMWMSIAGMGCRARGSARVKVATRSCLCKFSSFQ